MTSTLSPRTLCILVNYKDVESTLRCMDSLKGPNVDVVVVDNEGTPASTEALRQHSDHYSVINSEANLGFAGGVNLAVQQAGSSDYEYYWLLNNDALVTPETLSALEAASDAHSQAGVIGSAIYYEHDRSKAWSLGGKVHKPWYIVRHYKKPLTHNSAREVDFINGCSMLIRRSLFEAAGGFDESLFLYGEDVDFCERAKQLGYTLLLAPESIVFHGVSVSTGGEGNPLREYYLTRNGFALLARRYSNSVVRLLVAASRLPWDLYRFIKIARSKSTLTISQALRMGLQASWEGLTDRLGKVSLSR